MKKYSLIPAALITLFGITGCHLDSDSPKHNIKVEKSSMWVGAWGSAVYDMLAELRQSSFSYLGKKYDIEDQTLRLIVNPTQSGDKVRLRFSNVHSDEPLTFGNVMIGESRYRETIVNGTNTPVTFNGNESITIEPGTVIASDEIPFEVFAQQPLAVSVYVPNHVSPRDMHENPKLTHYIADGNVTDLEQEVAFIQKTPLPFVSMPTYFREKSLDISSKIIVDKARQELEAMANSNLKSPMYWLTSVEVQSTRDSNVIVAIGDSITDGACTSVDTKTDYPAALATRIFESSIMQGSQPFASVINMGIGGNTITDEVAIGDPIPLRLKRDVLDIAGVSHVILWAGTNDLDDHKPDEPADAERVISYTQGIIDELHSQGIKVIGVTMLPRDWAMYRETTEEEFISKERYKTIINDWIRNKANFDGVIDAHKILEDPSNPNQLNPQYNCDGVHPTGIGYEKLANSIDLSMFE